MAADPFVELSAALISGGYIIVRQVQTVQGRVALLSQPPVVPADLADVDRLTVGAGYEPAVGYPVWMPLRKLVLVDCMVPA